MFVRYHLNIGVDHMYLFFDDPDDPGAKALADNQQVTCIRCNSDYWATKSARTDLSINERQKINTGIALNLARRSGVDWIIHIDSDELLYTKGPLKELLTTLPEDLHVLKFPTMEAVVDKFGYERAFQEISLFKIHPGMIGEQLSVNANERMRLAYEWQRFRRKLRVAHFLGCTAVIEGHYLRGHTQGKSAVRTRAGLRGLACHEPIPDAGETLHAGVADGGWLLHFDSRGFESWKEKWLRLTRPDVRLSKHRRRLVAKFASLHESNNARALAALYKKLYFVPRYQRLILSRLGLLQRIRLGSELFNEVSEGVGNAKNSSTRPVLEVT